MQAAPAVVPSVAATPPLAARATPATTAATTATYAPAALRSPAVPQAGDLRFDPDPDLPIMQPASAFEETTEEIGPAEANDLSAPEDDLVLDAPPAAAPPAPARPSGPGAPVRPAATPAPAALVAAPVVQLPALENLNYRMIQYARRAAQLMQERTDFGVIYAPNWPAWLAALEIRNSSRLPLVLYAATLAADFARPAERGWLLEVERMTLRRAHLILVPDAAAQRHLHAHYPGLPGEVRIVPAHDEAAVQQVLRETARAR